MLRRSLILGAASAGSVVGALYASALGAQELARADVVIRPQVGKIDATDFDQKDKAILEGERAVAQMLPELRQAILTWQSSHV